MKNEKIRVTLYYAISALVFALGSKLVTFYMLMFIPQEHHALIELTTSLFAIFLGGYFLFFLFQILVDPLDPFMKKVKRYEFDESLSQIAANLSREIGINNPPKVFVSEDYLQIMSYGFPTKSVIFIWKGFSNTRKDVLEGFIAHELWHIKCDIDSGSFILTEESKRMLIAVPLCLFVILYFYFILLPSLFFMGPFSPITHPLFLIILMIFTVVLVFTLCLLLCLIITFIYLWLLNLTTLTKSAYREFLADSYAALTLKDPRKIALAIQEASLLLSVNPLQAKKSQRKYSNAIHLNFISFKKSEVKLKNEKSWLDILKVGWRDSHPPIIKRWVLLYLINKLLSSSVSLRVKRSSEKMESIKKRGILFWSPLSSTFGVRFMEMRSEKIMDIYHYMRSHPLTFNLIECSSSTQNSVYDVFTVFIIFLSAKIVEIAEPIPPLSEVVTFFVQS